MMLQKYGSNIKLHRSIDVKELLKMNDNAIIFKYNSKAFADYLRYFIVQKSKNINNYVNIF